MSHGITMLQGLPQNVPFIPQVEVRDNLRQHLRRITGELMNYMQQQGHANSLVKPLYELVAQNVFNNQAFTQLVQDSVIILDYMMSNTQPTPLIDNLLRDNIQTICIGASASYATRNPQIIQMINNPNIQLQAVQAADTYSQLSNTAKNWFQGAKMNQFYQQPGFYPQQPMVPGYGQPMMAPAMAQMPQAAYAQPAMMNPQAMAYYGQQQQQRPGQYVNPQQTMVPGQQFQPQQAFYPQQPAGAYVPQVAGGVYNPNMQPQYYGQPQQPYGISAPTQGPRTGGLGQAIPGVQSNQPMTQEQQNYVPQTGFAPQAATMAPAYQNQPNLGNPAVGQNLPQQAQHQSVTVAAAAVATHPAPLQPVQTQPVVQQQPQPVQQPEIVTTADGTKELIATESTPYRIPIGAGYLRLPFMYDCTTEVHRVRVNTKGEVIEQKVESKDDVVNLSDHKTESYFIVRTKHDLVNPNLKVFTEALDRAGNEINVSTIMESIVNLQDKNEEEIHRETAVILRDSLSKSLLVINDVFVMSSGYSVKYHEQFKTLVSGPIAAKVNEVAATFRSVSVSKFIMSDDTAKIANLVTTSQDLYQLHQHFCRLTDRMIGSDSSPLIDQVTDFVNVELKRYFGLPWKMTSFQTDMLDMLDLLTKEEGEEFAGLVAAHIHERLTTTLLYAYTPAEINEVVRHRKYEEADIRMFARVDQAVLLPVRSRDMPYTYNGRAGLILATSYQSLNRLIKNAFEMAGTHVAELKIITLDGDIIHIHPIANDNSFVMFKSDENRQ